MERRAGKWSKKGPLLMLLVLIFALSLLVVSRTSYFMIGEIIIQGNRYVSDEEIRDRAGIQPGENIFTVRPGEIKNQLETHPLIAEAEVNRKLPGVITITVKERGLVGYTPFIGSYLLLDDECKVISATTSMPVNGLPVFYGIEVGDFELNKILAVENQELFDRIKYISKYAVVYLSDYSPVEVDVSDLEDIKILLDERFQVKIGNINSIEYKLRFADTILEKLYLQDVGGEVDVSSGEKAFFRPW
ncbi:MAG: hypothetical protein HPY66_0082 [Firmicutes bacterium]|nr:hypothetical protein [Bacillota bacterium]MDI6706322.1 FtsQ-type POTRA domain-containing protein [Bacillota bacterium]